MPNKVDEETRGLYRMISGLLVCSRGSVLWWLAGTVRLTALRLAEAVGDIAE